MSNCMFVFPHNNGGPSGTAEDYENTGCW